MEKGETENYSKILVSFCIMLQHQKPVELTRTQEPSWWDNKLDNVRAVKHYKCLRFPKTNSDFVRSEFRSTRIR